MFKSLIEFKNFTPTSIKFRELKRCLTNEEMSISGYIYEEAVKTTFKSSSECCELLEFILNALNEVAAPVHKLKVLKMLRHLAQRGEPTFVEMLSKKDRLIKEASGFSSSADQIYGNNLSTYVRNEAQELLNFIHSSSRSSNPLISGNDICGLGSYSLKSGKYDGFGSSRPVSTNILDRVVNGITDLMDDMRKSGKENACDIEHQLRRELLLDGGSYIPVKLPQMSDQATFECFLEKEPVPKPIQIKQRVKGRPGGGWDEEEMENDFVNIKVSLESAENSQRLVAGLEEIAAFPRSPQHTEYDNHDADNDEQRFVNEILEMTESFKSWKNLDLNTNRCKTLKFESVLVLLCEHIQTTTEDTAFRILQFFEAVIYAGVIPCDLFHSIVGNTILNLSKSNLPSLCSKANKINVIMEKLLEANNKLKTL